MSNLVNCAHCNREINLDTDAQTHCSKCKKDFCFAMSSTCFTEYHRENKLFDGHTATSISNPSWKINIKVVKE